MTYADLEAVAAIERLSFSSPWSRDSFRRLIARADSDLFVAEVEGRVAGYAVVWYAADEAELGNLAVSPEWRRRGLGASLLDRAIECAHARGACRIFLEVRKSNAAAERLYRSRGFELVGVRPRYYQRPVEDAKVLCLDLRPRP
jgi:ribosomal-protein-alanine N-acetyltransferase